MPEISEFFQRNLVIIFFIYGLGFFVIASAILLSIRPLAAIGLAAASFYIILFSIIHGTVEFIDMYAQYKWIIHGLHLTEGAGIGRLFLLISSFYFLLLFGLQLTMRNASRIKTYVIVEVNTIFLLSVIYIALSCVLKTNPKEVESATRFLVGVPSAILVGIGLYRLSFNNYLTILTEDYRWYFKGVAYASILYGIFAGLIGPKSNILFAPFFNQDLFFEYTGIPIQVLRATAAFLISYFVIRAMPLSIAVRILGSLIAVSTIVVVLGFTSYINFTALGASHNKILKLASEDKDFSYIQHSFNRLHSLMSNPAIYKNRQTYRPLLKEYIKDFEASLNEVKAMEHTDKEEMELISKIFMLSRPILRWETANIDTTNWNRLKSMIDEINKIHLSELEEFKEDAAGIFTNAKQVALAAFFVSILAVIFIWHTTARLIVKPLHTLRAGTKQIADGNLEHRIAIHTADELQRFAVDFNTMTKKLQDRTIKLEKATKELEKLSITDGLTGLFNHRHFHSMAEIEFEGARRYDTNLSILIIDVDNFKYYNDKHGHPSGDKVLKTLGSLTHKNTRSSDVACRYGGEEFAVLLPQTDKNHAVIAAEKIRHIIQSHEFPYEKTQPLGDVTVSIGVASYPTDAKGIKKVNELIEKADKALYKAKNEGRNKVCAS